MRHYTVEQPEPYILAKKGGRKTATVNVDIKSFTDEMGNVGYSYISVTIAPLTYENIVSSILNSLYPSDKVQALTANYNEARDAEELSEDKRKEYMDEYHAYQAKRKEVKAFAREIISTSKNTTL